MRFLAATALVSFACAHPPSPTQERAVDELSESGTERLLEEDTELRGSTESEALPPAGAESQGASQPKSRCAALTAEGHIRQSALDEVVDAGLGRWLQGVRVERVLEKNKFQGWKVQVLHLANPCYAAVDIRPGDVVTSINGSGAKKLERPESAQAIFNSLRQAKAIQVQYLRNGLPGTVTYTVVPEQGR